MGLDALARQNLISMMAAQAAARHRIPKADCLHPKGVIVPNSEFMTEKLQDPDYVPYCGPCVPMQRLRRVSDGFLCPNCGNHSNWDLTKFNGNKDVQFDMSIEGAGVIPEQPEPPKPPEPKRDWDEDKGKKNTETKKCGHCAHPFFGLRKRKVCVACQPKVNVLREQLHAANERKPAEAYYSSRKDRRRYG